MFGFTQKTVADILGISVRQYQNYESGLVIPPVDNLKVISDIYNLPLSDFFDERPLIEKDKEMAFIAIMRQHYPGIITALSNVDPDKWDALEEMILPICKHLTTKEDK